VGAETLVTVEGSTRGLAKVRDVWSTGVVDYGTSVQGLSRNLGDPCVPVLEVPGRTAG